MTELTPEQIAEIRRQCEPTKLTEEEQAEMRALCESGRCGGCVICWGPPIKVAGCDDVLALCDTVDAVRAEMDVVQQIYIAVFDQAHSELDLMADNELAPNLPDADEASVPERIAQLRDEVMEPMVAELETLRGIAKRLREGWYVVGTDWLYSGLVQSTVEPMTEAEVAAIYGSKDDT